MATEVLRKYRTSYRTHPPKIPYNTVHFQKKITVHTVHSPLPVPYKHRKQNLMGFKLCLGKSQKKLLMARPLRGGGGGGVKGRAIKKKKI